MTLKRFEPSAQRFFFLRKRDKAVFRCKYILKNHDFINLVVWKNIIYLVWNAELWKLFSKDPLPLSKMIVIVKQLFKINLSANPCKNVKVN